eukprot:gene917-224_t
MQTNNAEARKEKSMLFTITDVRHSLIEFINYFKQPIDKLTDAELIQVKTDMMYKVDAVKNIAMKYELILQTRFTNEEPIKHIRIIYSATDFYTFKDNFNKLHELSTPKHLLPELLKNNFLKGPALSMVKSLTDIDEIWKQLQFAYGDVKMLLAKKLKHVSTIDSLSKFNDVNALAHSLSRIITSLNELVHLTEKHRIEDNHYYSDGLHRVYNLLDEG